MAQAHDVRFRRVYDDPEEDDGQRVLIDRLWPRGLSKAKADLDEWCKDISPSTELRHWFDHRPDRLAQFEERYRAELTDPEHTAALGRLRELAGRGTITLLTASKDLHLSHGNVLVELLHQHPGRG